MQRDVDEWIRIFENKTPGICKRLKSLYGDDTELINTKINEFLNVAVRFKETFPQANSVSFIRAPARLNTLGMHVDHRGSFINPIALSKEIIICYSARNDEKIEIYNLAADYGKRSFNISSIVPDEPIKNIDEWLSWTINLCTERIKDGTSTDWINKIKAVVTYLKSYLYPSKKLSGFNGVLTSDIPAKAGLSSSSAIVVAIMEILVDINNIAIDKKDFAYHCGVAEWYVGTRGGFGDQAAIKYCKLGKILHMKTTPELIIDKYIPFPKGYKIIIFNSCIEADKTGKAGQKFNEKIATYEIGEIYIRRYMGRHLQHLADIIENLTDEEIYKLLLVLPENISRNNLLKELPDYKNELQKQFQTHNEPENGYDIRGVCTYGISECKRAKILPEVIKKKDIQKFGMLMNISHDGDRVSNISPDLRAKKQKLDTAVDLIFQPGSYDCSISEIDEMVDIAKDAGSIGAKISGAGLGGSIMVLIEDKKIDLVLKAMREKYYKKYKIKEMFIIAEPVEGACKL